MSTSIPIGSLFQEPPDGPIRAIPTRYAGCHFRSRLEARWAVAFDHLGIRWEYEREGYLCSPRLSQFGFPDAGTTIPYLPDFWFPDYELHGEVKGRLTDDELLRLLDCAASLSSADGMGCHDSGGHDLVVLGNIPQGEGDRLPTVLHLHKGDLIAWPWLATPGRPTHHRQYPSGIGEIVAQDSGGGTLESILVAKDQHEPGVITPARLSQWLTRGSWGCVLGWDERFRQWWAAYAAARSARFEHGQSGAT